MQLKNYVLGPVVGILALAPVAANGGDGSSCSKVNAVINPGNQKVVEASMVNGQRVQTVVQLDGTNSNPKNRTTCLWTQESGTKVKIIDPRSCQTTFTAPEVGPTGQDVTFRLLVRSTEPGCTELTDTNGTTISVANLSTNRPPVAVVAAPASAAEGLEVTLDGRASSDADGDPLTFSWTQISGTAVNITVPAPGLATFTAPPEQYPDGENLKFVMTVSDGYLSDSREFQIAVQSVNQAPIASISCPAQVNEGDAVVLSDNQSYDPDQRALTYLWNNIQGVPSADMTGVVMIGSTLNFRAPLLTAPSFDTMKFGLTVTDDGNLSGFTQCDVKVLDVTPPVISGTSDVTKEATSSAGVVVTYSPVASDAFYGDVEVTCDPKSDSTFSLGETTVKCSASDMAAVPNTAEVFFRVAVVDTTPPSLTLPEFVGPVEGNVLGGANVNYFSTAMDAVDGAVRITCDTASGSLFPVGNTTVACSATDSHNNTAKGTFKVTVQDTSPPFVAVPSLITAEATGPSGAVVTFSSSSQDVVDGSSTPTCQPASGALFSLGETTVHCAAADKAGNTGSNSFTVAVKDSTPPVVTPPADLTVYATGLLTPVTLGNATATDAVGVYSLVNDSPAAGFPVGTTAVTWTAKDKAGNTGTGTSYVTVKPWTLSGFYAPIDMRLTNTVKGGATVPVKFRAFAGSTELTSTSAVSSIKIATVSCNSMSAVEDSLSIDGLGTGGTVLRYDTTEGQFIFNWQTSKVPGTCYVLSATTLEGSKIAANFKLK